KALTFLQLDRCSVSDLTPLRGMPLGFLGIRGSNVKDISPLRDMPLKALYLNGSNVVDLSPCRDLPELEQLGLDVVRNKKGINALRRLKQLKFIYPQDSGDAMEAAEFWKRYDAGEFGK